MADRDIISTKPTLRQRFRKAATADNIVDLSVDVFLIVFDVLSSPILIVMRVLRWLFKKFISKNLKRVIKFVVHWFMDNRKKRLELGRGILRHYWYLWLASPIIILAILFGIAILTGLITGLEQGINEGINEL
tara:strand:- start:7841 stop:8239 length:399 start_codon:yes stop_codon:yes gene_type:complete